MESNNSGIFRSWMLMLKCHGTDKLQSDNTGGCSQDKRSYERPFEKEIVGESYESLGKKDIQAK